MFIESWPFPLSVPDDVFEPPVLALPKLTRRVPVPGVLLALRTVNVTLNCEPMFTRAGPLKDTTLPSANVIDVPCGGGAVGTGVRAGVGTGVPPGRCVGAGVASAGVAEGSADTATGADGSVVTPGAFVGAALAFGVLCVPATTAAAPPPTMRITRTMANSGAGLLFLTPALGGATWSGTLYAPCHCAASSRPRGARTVAIHSLLSRSKKYVWMAWTSGGTGGVVISGPRSWIQRAPTGSQVKTECSCATGALSVRCGSVFVYATSAGCTRGARVRDDRSRHDGRRNSVKSPRGRSKCGPASDRRSSEHRARRARSPDRKFPRSGEGDIPRRARPVDPDRGRRDPDRAGAPAQFTTRVPRRLARGDRLRRGPR